MTVILDKYLDNLDTIQSQNLSGIVTNVVGLIIESIGPKAFVGEICNVVSEDGINKGKVEVIGFRNKFLILMVLGRINDIKLGDRVVGESKNFVIPVGRSLLGRILNGMGEPIDGLGPLHAEEMRPVHNSPPNPLDRKRITEQLYTGVRSIDVFNACGKGQRTGIFAGSGVGKSVILGMISRNTSADVNVIALIGERGREVKEFIENDLGSEGLKRSVVVTVTSDEAALLKIKAILTANTIAEYFRDERLDVMLLVDSLSRTATAQREIGLAVGELPTTKGYTPSVFSMLPKIVERAGCDSEGSITGFYTVLVEGDEMDDPVADAVRSYLDGHIVLSRKLALKNRFPAIDILQSMSRLMKDISSNDHKLLADDVRSNLAYYEEAEDLINIGAYTKGNDPKIDRAMDVIDNLTAFMIQKIDEKSNLESDLKSLAQILRPIELKTENISEEVQVQT